MVKGMRSVRSSGFRARAARLVHAGVLVILAACGDSTSAPPIDGGPAVSPQVVDVSFCTGAQPSWVAFQDGDGSWTETLPTIADGKFRFRRAFMSDRATMALMRPAGEMTMLFVQYAAPAELAAVGDTTSALCGPAHPKSLLGRVEGLDTSDIAVVSASASARTFIFPDESLNFALLGLTDGPQDLLAVRSPRANRGDITRMILRRIPAVTDGAPEIGRASCRERV